MTTEVYGASDDLIEFEGDLRGEVNFLPEDEETGSALAIMSDGTILKVRYGKNDEAIWEVGLVKRGSLFDRIEPCDDEDADPHSDVAHFKDGIKWGYAAKEWEKVR